MNTLRIEHCTAGYQKNKPVLEDISLCIEEGEITVLLGENGCGKTTLLRALQGNLTHTSGKILVGETDITALSPRRRAVYVTTMHQQQPDTAGLTGMDRIETAFYPVRGPFFSLTDRDRERITAAAQTFGAEHLLHRELGKMSTGERQMIALLRAAVQDTPVLLLDEPASALDYNHTQTLFALLHTLAGQGKIILAVLHDPAAALLHASKLVHLGGGGVRGILDVKKADHREAEAFLRKLYPQIRVHDDPLFCYTEQ
ncbi:MAG: ABC transporter ATP-binding protein [Clostridia bacterium]|nr:ABC transporter ATP-binding protein [Clostridia bacterium]